MPCFVANLDGTNSVKKKTANTSTTSRKGIIRKKTHNFPNNENDAALSDPKLIQEEEVNFYKKKIYSFKQTDPESKTFASFFESEGLTFLNNLDAEQCEGLLTLEECAKAVSNFQNDKTP